MHPKVSGADYCHVSRSKFDAYVTRDPELENCITAKEKRAAKSLQSVRVNKNGKVRKNERQYFAE